MFWNVLTNENTKIIKRKLFWVEIALVALIVIGLLLALYITIEINRNGTGLPSKERLMVLETITWPAALVNILRLAGWDGFGPLFLIVLVGAVTAQEYTWRTLHLWLARGVPRPLLLIAKLTAFLLAAILIVMTALGAGGAITAIISMKINGSLYLGQLDLQHLFFSILRTIFTLLPYGMQVIGFLGERFSQMVSYLPGSLANSLLTLNNATLATGGSTGNELITPFLASIGIAAWTLLFIDLSLWIFQRQDLAE
jgi:ABC-type transport system involved in multi-copper enzyme maturation permease subunit